VNSGEDSPTDRPDELHAGEEEPAGQKPAIFISHKHADRAIADALRNWISDVSLGGVTTYQSTFPDNAPRVGAPLNDELRRQLHDSQAVVCLFTSPDEDWAYCMWECGVATDPMTEGTRIIVFQFSDAYPPPFQDRVRVDVREKTDIQKFVRSFLTDPDFFPGQGHALAPDLPPAAPQVETKAEDLYNRLTEVVPGAIEEWPAWGYFILQLPSDEVERVKQEASADKRVQLVEEQLRGSTLIVKGDKTAKGLFGRAVFPPGLTFAQVLQDWTNQYPDASDQWVLSLAHQIELAARGSYPLSDWSVMRGATRAGEWCIPVVTWVRTLPSRDMQFDVYFLPVRGVDEEAGRLDLGVNVPQPNG
jgi:TIR domain